MTADWDITRRAAIQFFASGTMLMTLPLSAHAIANKPSFAVTRPIHIHSVALRVNNLPMMSGFYNQIMGLDIISASDAETVLGKDGLPLVTLVARPAFEPDDGRSAGLYHTAFLMPTREALGKWLIFAVKNGVPFTGFADHRVSEALYLNDPEGNGIEVYADRAPESWTWTNNLIQMGTDQLNIDSLVSGLPQDAALPYVAPSGFRIGHVHLRVGDTAKAGDFYIKTAGLDLVARVPDSSAIFLANGKYHHHIGANIWQSRGAGLRNEKMAGLDDLAFSVSEPLMDGLRGRLTAAGADFQEKGDTIEALDPWGTKVRFISA